MRRGLITGVVLIFLISIVLSIIILQPSEKSMVEIVSDGEVLYTIDLLTTKDKEIKVYYEDSSNTICIGNGEIRVKEAECPDKRVCTDGQAYFGGPAHCMSSQSFDSAICAAV